MLIAAIEERDLPLVQTIAMVAVSAILFANLAADVACALLNPRVGFG